MLIMAVHVRDFALFNCMFVLIFHNATTWRDSRDVENRLLQERLCFRAYVSPYSRPSGVPVVLWNMNIYETEFAHLHMFKCSTSQISGVFVVMWNMHVYERGFAHLHTCPHPCSTSRFTGVSVVMLKIDVYMKGFAHLHIVPIFHLAIFWRVSRDVENEVHTRGCAHLHICHHFHITTIRRVTCDAESGS